MFAEGGEQDRRIKEEAKNELKRIRINKREGDIRRRELEHVSDSEFGEGPKTEALNSKKSRDWKNTKNHRQFKIALAPVILSPKY